MPSEFPNRYDDPLYVSLDAKTEQKLGLPVGLLSSIRERGEKSNNDQVSEASARTPYQIIPSTRRAAIDKFGVDPMLSPENASEVAGLLLKDSLDRNKGDAAAAVGEYHGGTSRDNWGPRTRAYVNRVMIGQQQSKRSALENGFSQFMAENPAVPAGRSMAAASASAPASGTSPSSLSSLEQGFGAYLEAGPRSMEPVAEPGVLARTADIVTGGLRRTPETDALPDWAGMPELNSLSLASAKTGLGTMLSNPAETAQIIKSNFPDAQVRQDSKGNFLIRSAEDGKEYAIKPGFQVSDIPRALGALAAFTPAGGARTLAGSALAATGTQAVIEGTQAATGGEFNVGEVATAGALGGIAPAVMRAGSAMVDSAKGLLSRVRGTPAPALAAREAAGASSGGSLSPATLADEISVTAPAAQGVTAAPKAEVPASNPAPAINAAAEEASHIWRTADNELPVKFIRVEPQPGPDGRMYARVEHGGRESFVPAEELSVTKPQRGAPQAGEAAPPVQSAPASTAQTSPAEILAAAPSKTPDELAGTARTAALGGFGSKKATRELAAEVAPDAETVAAAERLGVLQHLQPDHYTTNQAYRQLAQLVKSQTGSSAAVAQREGLLKLAETADGLITKMGGSADLSTLSADAAQRMQATHAGLKARARELYNEVDAQIGAASEAPAPNIVALIKDNARKLGGEDNLPPVERDLLKRLAPKEDGTEPTYALLDKLRKDIGEARRGKQNAFGNSNSAELTQLENALRADQAAIAEKAGVGGLWETAQATARAYKSVQEDMKAIYGKELDKSMAPMLTGAVKSLGKGDTSQFIKLLKATPEGMRKEVTASGLASFFQKTSRGGEMDFAGYSRWYDGLKQNGQAYSALMSNLPLESAKQLADLARVAKGVAMSKGEFIATGKALNPKVLEAADGLMANVFEEVKRRGMSGALAEVVGTVAGAPGLASVLQSAVKTGKPSAMKAADALITSPEFVALVRAAGTPAEKSIARRFAQSPVFSRYVAELGRPREMSNRERWVLEALQGKNNVRD